MRREKHCNMFGKSWYHLGTARVLLLTAPVTTPSCSGPVWAHNYPSQELKNKALLNSCLGGFQMVLVSFMEICPEFVSCVGNLF